MIQIADPVPRSTTATLAETVRNLARHIPVTNHSINAAVLEAADRLEEQHRALHHDDERWEKVSEFFIPGKPKSAGSKSAMPLRRGNGEYVKGKGGRIVINMVDSCNNKDWIRSCQIMARKYFRQPPLECPLRVHWTFIQLRPKGHYRGKAQELRADAPPFPAVQPDATKLIRCVEDAMSGIVWKDDNLIVDQQARKLYGPREGCLQEVWRYRPAEPETPIFNQDAPST